MSVRKLNLALFTVALTGSLMIGTCLMTLAEAKDLRGGVAADAGDSNREKIARAMSAGPIDVAISAIIVDRDAQGHEVVLREGDNGFTCMPGNAKVIGEPPMCADAASMQWSADFKAHKPKPTNTVPGITYMLAGATQRSDSDPYDKTSPAIEVGPHWMIMWPFDPKATGLQPRTRRQAPTSCGLDRPTPTSILWDVPDGTGCDDSTLCNRDPRNGCCSNSRPLAYGAAAGDRPN